MPNDLNDNLDELKFTKRPRVGEILPTETPDQTSAPERTVEFGETPKIKIKEDENFLEETIEGLKNTLKRNKKKPTNIPQVKDEVMLKIEKIMEQDLGDVFKELTPIQQQEFKIKGEEAAWEIRKLLKSAHIKIKAVFRLILEWLKMLPGINRFFLEQEAKIKTDHIIALKEEAKKN